MIRQKKESELKADHLKSSSERNNKKKRMKNIKRSYLHQQADQCMHYFYNESQKEKREIKGQKVYLEK